MSAQRIVFRSFGVPEDVVEVETIEPSPPSANEVSVRMEAAPINPADLNYIEGVYGVKPDLPAAAGLEGFGRVSATGPGVTTLAVGDPVIFLSSRGTWASEVVCPAGSVIPIPAGLDPIQAAMLKVNPLTALRLLQDFGQPPAGAWVAQNAANSAVGQCVIQVAKAIGLRTLNFVRRPEAIAPLEALGADCVLLDEAGSAKDAPGKPALAFNAVGGDSATRLMDLLAEGGKLITYGAMGRQALKVPNKFLLFKGLQLHGLWVTRWLRSAPRGVIAEAYAFLAGLMAAGSLAVAVEATYPLDRVAEAIRHAKTERRTGKIVLTLA